MIKHVFLDLDNTLFDFDAAERLALTKAWRGLGIDVTDEMLSRYSVINIAHWEKLETGELTRTEVLVKRFEALYKEYGIELDAAETNRIYEGYLAIGHIFMPGAPELLESLHGRYRLYIASNGLAATQAGRIKSADIARYFDGIFVSETLGANKPGRVFFELCAKAIGGFEPSEAVMIGDSLTSDILGGLNYGMHTVWLNTKGKTAQRIIPEYTVTSLYDIPELLNRM